MNTQLLALRKFLPELFLVLGVLVYWFFTATLFNIPAIVLLIILGSQMIRRNQISGMIIGILFLILTLYMLLALASEFSEFPTFDAKAQELLLGGLLVLLPIGAIAVWMIVKYSSEEKNV